MRRVVQHIWITPTPSYTRMSLITHIRNGKRCPAPVSYKNKIKIEACSFLIHICLGLIMAKAWLMRHRDPGLHTLSHTHARVTGQSGTVREWKLLTVHLHHLAAAAEMFGFLAHLLKTSKAAGWWKNSCKLCQVSHWTTHRPATFFIGYYECV